MPQKVILLFGPTGVGKTDLIIKLFSVGFEIVSADSVQVYKYMNIGTAKPDMELLKLIPHHLLDVRNPDQSFNAGEFVRLAGDIARDIQGRGKFAVLSGGTAFYLKNFACGLSRAPRADSQIRDKLKKRLREEGIAALYKELEKVDPSYCGRISSRDSQRVLRALEVYRQTGLPLSAYRQPEFFRREYDFLLLGLFRPRDELSRRINARVNAMFKAGLIDEVRSLIKMGYRETDPGMRAIGYREFFEMRESCCLLEETREYIKKNTRDYAKRQMTFFKSLPDVHWYSPEKTEAIREDIDKFLAKN